MKRRKKKEKENEKKISNSKVTHNLTNKLNLLTKWNTLEQKSMKTQSNNHISSKINDKYKINNEYKINDESEYDSDSDSDSDADEDKDKYKDNYVSNNNKNNNNNNNLYMAKINNFINFNKYNDNTGLINWKTQFYNDKFVYGINPSVDKLLLENENPNGYFLSQYTGPELELNNNNNNIVLTTPINPINPDNNISAIFYGEINTQGDIIDATNLWFYDGVRENYQFGQLLFTQGGDLMILSTFTGIITFIDGSQLTAENSGSNIIGRFNRDGTPQWILRINAQSIDDIYFTLDNDDNIYICGTFSGTLTINDPSFGNITSNLDSNMFIGRINNNGQAGWLQTSGNGSNSNTGEGIDFSGSDNTIVTIGTYTGNITFINNDGEDVILNNSFAIFNTWIAKYDLNGDLVYVTTPLSPPNNEIIQTDFIEGSQVVVDSIGNIYIVGEVRGNFIFDEEDVFIDVEDISVFITKSNSSGNWEWINILQVDIPLNNQHNPRLTVVEDTNCIYMTNFGIGNIHYINSDLVESDTDLGFTCCGSGSLDLFISKLSIDVGNWLCSSHIAGTVCNESIDIISRGIEVYIAGTHCVNSERTDAFIINIES